MCKHPPSRFGRTEVLHCYAFRCRDCRDCRLQLWYTVQLIQRRTTGYELKNTHLLAKLPSAHNQTEAFFFQSALSFDELSEDRESGANRSKAGCNSHEVLPRPRPREFASRSESSIFRARGETPILGCTFAQALGLCVRFSRVFRLSRSTETRKGNFMSWRLIMWKYKEDISLPLPLP
jgi:hypothetical protein